MAANPAQPPFALTISAEARAAMAPMLRQGSPPEFTMTLMRCGLARKMIRKAALNHLKPIAKARMALHDVDVKREKIAGVSVDMVRPKSNQAAGNALLINMHGGGFTLDSGSLTESIPIAGLTRIPVASVLYRMAPEHPYPAAVDDVLAVYKDALATRSATAIGVFGTSAGAMLTLQLLARIKAEGMAMPAAAGFFSGAGDFVNVGDCEGYLPSIMGERTIPEVVSDYCVGTDRADPLLSPILGDLSGFPPMLLMSSTRDQLLSHTVITDLALRKAGVDVDLRVYEGMAHAFWAWIECPETEVALAAQAEFFSRLLKA